ncbi:MAG: glycosyltransferase family 39 protein, partial [Bacteroidota bacterium]|nr:glycosyltransferase family 39 protein [Bacteroidota bacterium]
VRSRALLAVGVLGLVLGAVVWRWARALYGYWGAVIALILFALSPNILAYTRLATPDIARAALLIAALFAWSRALHRQTLGALVVAGVVFGLALSTVFAALLLIPVFIFMAVGVSGHRGPLRIDRAGPLTRAVGALGRAPLGWLWSALAVLIVIGLLGGAVLAVAGVAILFLR